ncbi:MAG: hypothetical protein ACXVB9_09070 [Bdellovibrionota bacterium]
MLFSGAAAGYDFSQMDALAAAQRINKSGSDQSMQASTTSAMTALMKLANADTTGAISKGYQAFGQYRNSGDLDGLRLKNSITALKMDSIGNYLAQNGKDSIFMAPISDYSTTYARLDPAFLRQGEAGKVADEFEKQSGMPREVFLKQMTQASDSNIKVSDPQLVDKVLTRFEGFVSQIPNTDFRNKVQAQIDRVPQTVRTGLISKAVQQFTVMFAGASVSPKTSTIALAPKDAKATGAASTGAAAATAEATAKSAVAGGLKPSEDRSLASAVAGSYLQERKEFRNISDDQFGADAVGGVLQTALDEQTEDTIFKQVSRKYRSLSPSLLAQQAL